MITIGIPSYNQEPYLAEAIESALNQTVPCTVIVCNDGSTDRSLEIAKKYPVQVIDQVNKGLASARNAIIMNSFNPWILFLDADDKLESECIERIEKEIKYTDADVIAPSFKCFGLASQDMILMTEPKLEDFRTGNRIGYCAAIRREKLVEVGGYSPRMTFGYEDLHLWINLLSRGNKFITIPEILWQYRIKEQSMITEAQKHHAELLAQINKDFPDAKIAY